MNKLGAVISIFLVIIIVVCIFFISGSPSLRCKINTNNYKSKVIVKYKDGMPTTYKEKDKWIYNFNDMTSAEISYHSEYERYGVLISEKKAKISLRQNIVNKSIKYNFTKDNSSGEGLLLINKTSNMKEAKKMLKERGYFCK